MSGWAADPRGRIALLALLAAYRQGREQLQLALDVVRLLGANAESGRKSLTLEAPDGGGALPREESSPERHSVYRHQRHQSCDTRHPRLGAQEMCRALRRSPALPFAHVTESCGAERCRRPCRKR